MDSCKNLFIIFDDRDYVSNDVQSLVGRHRYGNIIFKRQTLFERFRKSLPQWAASQMIRLQNSDDLIMLYQAIISASENSALFIVASHAGFENIDELTNLVDRLPYAQDDFTESLYAPQLVFMRDAHDLIRLWDKFKKNPVHRWEGAWKNGQRLLSVKPMNLSFIGDFLSFMSGSTSSRYFNKIEIGKYYYTKSSQDKNKMLAEYNFYNLVPESFRIWLIQPFEYRNQVDHASYKMLRYNLADAALQWVHGGFTANTFEPFVERLLFFLSERPRQVCDRRECLELGRNLFLRKVEKRLEEFMSGEDGRHINNLVASSDPYLDVRTLFKRYQSLYSRLEKDFLFSHKVVGHGDPCFSNILYDQQRQLLKFIDPMGATKESDLWTHPLYDVAKISQSILGDYDLINNGRYTIKFSNDNSLKLVLSDSNHASLKPIFIENLKKANYDAKIIRLGEASLFLSMLPMHMDHQNKVMAFILNAKNILDEVEIGI